MKACSRGAVSIASFFLGALALACGGRHEGGADSAAFELCAGNYQGSYRGDVTGTLTGSVDRAGKFTVAFAQHGSGTSLRGSGNVTEDGEISLKIQSNVVSGALDLATCAANGRWQFGAGATGTWQMKKQ